MEVLFGDDLETFEFEDNWWDEHKSNFGVEKSRLVVVGNVTLPPIDTSGSGVWPAIRDYEDPDWDWVVYTSDSAYDGQVRMVWVDGQGYVLDYEKQNQDTDDGELSLFDFKNSDGTYALYDNKRHDPNSIFHEQILVWGGSGPSISLNDGEFTIFSAEVALMTGGWEFEHVDLSLLDVGSVSVDVEFSKQGVHIGGFASIWNPSLSINVYDYTLELDFLIGSVGGSFEVSEDAFGFGYAAGCGFDVSIRKEQK